MECQVGWLVWGVGLVGVDPVLYGISEWAKQGV